MPSPVRRSTRGAPAPSKSTPPASNHSSSSLSSEPPRRSQRSQPSLRDAGADPTDDDPADEEEITRCICGQQEYPGPPLSEAFASITDASSEDAGGLFILCDGCSVWQHGGCVGIVEENQSPDKYYCEECRPKLHELHTDSKGQKYSLYLPLHPKTQRKNSVSKSDEKAKKERDTAAMRTSVDPSTGKRRATMRSKEHDDEEEQLKRAIEESKREVEGSGSNGKRHGKRSREESEENKPDFKRQRTNSESLPSVTRTASQDEDSDVDPSGSGSGKSKKAKAEAVQSARQAEQREKARELEKSRAEAAGRRQERAGRRRGEEATDPVEESTPVPPTNSQPSPPAPPSQPASPPPIEKVSHKKGAGRKIKKLGNNQYTKNRGEIVVASPHSRRRLEKSTGSGDEALESTVNGDMNTSNHVTGSKASPGVENSGSAPNGKGKIGKGKKGLVNGTNGGGIGGTNNGNGGANNSDIDIERTFANMKSALDAMSSYVNRQQPSNEPPSASPSAAPSTLDDNLLTVGSTTTAAAAQRPPAARDYRNFDDLTSAEMAVHIQKNIASWQEKWGHLATPT